MVILNDPAPIWCTKSKAYIKRERVSKMGETLTSALKGREYNTRECFSLFCFFFCRAYATVSRVDFPLVKTDGIMLIRKHEK